MYIENEIEGSKFDNNFEYKSELFNTRIRPKCDGIRIRNPGFYLVRVELLVSGSWYQTENIFRRKLARKL